MNEIEAMRQHQTRLNKLSNRAGSIMQIKFEVVRRAPATSVIDD